MISTYELSGMSTGKFIDTLFSSKLLFAVETVNCHKYVFQSSIVGICNLANNATQITVTM